MLSVLTTLETNTSVNWTTAFEKLLNSNLPSRQKQIWQQLFLAAEPPIRFASTIHVTAKYVWAIAPDLPGQDPEYVRVGCQGWSSSAEKINFAQSQWSGKNIPHSFFAGEKDTTGEVRGLEGEKEVVSCKEEENLARVFARVPFILKFRSHPRFPYLRSSSLQSHSKVSDPLEFISQSYFSLLQGLQIIHSKLRVQSYCRGKTIY